MFQSYVNKLQAVKRFDRVVNSKHVEVGEVEVGEGRTALAIRTDDGPMTLEDRAVSQLVGQWDIPAEHFRKLPRELQAAELTHFATKQPRELTIRATHDSNANGGAGEYPAARAVLSGRYSPFDSAEVLQTIEPYLQGFELARPSIDRDEMVLAVTRPEEHDVSTRKVGDIVKTGLTVRNSEVGTMALAVEFSTWRLKCLNGMTVPSPEVTVRQRHIYVSRATFAIQLRNAVQNSIEMGRAVIGQLRAAHGLVLPNLDPDEGKLQESIARILRADGLWTKAFRESAEAALGGKEEASLFGLVQFITDKFAKENGEETRMKRERAAGRILQLAA